jgi:hypothetical protein
MAPAMQRADGTQRSLAVLVLATCACFAVVGSDGAARRPGGTAWSVVPGALLGRLRPRGLTPGAAACSMCSIDGGQEEEGVFRPQAPAQAVSAAPQPARRLSVRRASEPRLSEEEAEAQRQEFFSLRADGGDRGHAWRGRGSGSAWRETSDYTGYESEGGRPMRGSSRGRYMGERSRGGGASNIRLQSLDRYARIFACRLACKSVKCLTLSSLELENWVYLNCKQ